MVAFRLRGIIFKSGLIRMGGSVAVERDKWREFSPNDKDKALTDRELCGINLKLVQ